MKNPVLLQSAILHTASPIDRVARPLPQTDAPDIGQRMERLLWAEMLTHAGLEKSFTQGGGQAVSAFSRFIVEEIAKDLAEHHPLGIGETINLHEEAGDEIAEGDRS